MNRGSLFAKLKPQHMASFLETIGYLECAKREPRCLWDGFPPVLGPGAKAPVGGLGTKFPEAEAAFLLMNA